jgi:hypothetical protein
MIDVITEELRVLIQEELTKFFTESNHADEDKLLSREEAAEILGIQSNTLAVWAMKCIGPAPTKIGTKSMYSRKNLAEYISKNTMSR